MSYNFYISDQSDITIYNENCWVDKLISNSVIPIPDANSRNTLETLGVKFSQTKFPFDHTFHHMDDKFVEVKFPEGWRYEILDNRDRRHINLKDQNNKTVACIFIKYGGYD